MKSLALASDWQFSTPEAIFSSKMANSATQIAGNTVDMYNKLPGQILKQDASRQEDYEYKRSVTPFKLF